MSYKHNMPKLKLPTVIVRDKSAAEVARAMIDSGRQKEPFYIFDFDAVYQSVQNFREKLPRVQIFYALKSNDYSMMIKMAIALGLGFDCASPGEINKIRKFNVRPTSIIYAAPMKTAEQMIYARKSGVRHTTFDSLCELTRLKEHWPDSRLLIRIKLDSDSVYKLGEKFGCDYAEAVSLLEEADRLGMIVMGVAFHVGSGCFSKNSYTEGFRIARALFDHEIRAGRKMTLLDIGGGFFNDGSNLFDQVANLINSALAKWFPDPEIQIIAEPGRYICESAFTLYSSIRDIRKFQDSESNNTVNMIYISNGTLNSLKFIEKWHIMKKFKRTNDIGLTKDAGQDTIIWGPTMDDKDFIGLVKLTTSSVKDWASLKDKPVFSSTVFLMESPISLILPSVLPPIQFSYEKHMMNGRDYVISFKSHVTPAYVLDGQTPDDVARAMIESGRQAQPFYIFDMDEVCRRVLHFKKMMPRVKIFYAVKSNDTDNMLRLAVALGLGFDCASPGEIHKVRKLNVNPQSIIYAMPCKTTDEMEFARQAGVKHATFDSSYELKKIKKSWPDARLLIRIKLDGTAKRQLGLKFGCDFETEATQLLDEAASLGLNVTGVAFHVGSVCHSPERYVLALRQARALFDHEAKNGRTMDIVDIGGGFSSDKTDSIDELSHVINDALEELFPDPNIQVIAEPGRYLSDSAFRMFCSIIGVRKVVRNDVPVNMIYLNNGVYGTMRYDENWHKIYKYQLSAEPEPILDEETILWGPTCDCYDRVMQDYKVRLPRCSPNDWLVVDIHGAYTFTFSTRFSCLEIPLVRAVVSKDMWSILKKSSVYQTSDFIVKPEISAPLPSSLPPVIQNTEIYEHSEIPILKV